MVWRLRSQASLPLWPHLLEKWKGVLSLSLGPSLPCWPPADTGDQLQHPLRWSSQLSGGRAGMDLVTIQSNTPTLQMGKLRPWEAEQQGDEEQELISIQHQQPPQKGGRKEPLGGGPRGLALAAPGVGGRESASGEGPPRSARHLWRQAHRRSPAWPRNSTDARTFARLLTSPFTPHPVPALIEPLL